MSHVIAMMGPIGAGKTSQNQRLAARFNLETFSTGQLIREDTDQAAHEAMSRGDAAPTEYVQNLLLKRFSEIPADRGIVFDGPLMLEEAQAYQEKLPKFGHHIAAVILLQVSEDEVERRLTDRHEKHGRTDDHPETVRSRWERYHKVTLPVFEYYRSVGVPVIEVDGSGTPEEVSERVAAIAQEHGAS